MAKIYYKNSLEDFISLTYKDFGAAPAYHTHTYKDIQYRLVEKDKDTQEIIKQEMIPQVFPAEQGGTNMTSLNNWKAGKILYASPTGINPININNGVFGYFNGANNPPSFQTWPISAGGTSANNQYQAICNFDIGAMSTDTPHYINLNYHHIFSAHYIMDKTEDVWAPIIEFSIYLPYQLMPNTRGTLDLYLHIIQQPNMGTTRSTTFYYPTYTYNNTQHPALLGFHDASFVVGASQTSRNYVQLYGYNQTNTPTPINTGGLVDPKTFCGDVTIDSCTGGPISDTSTYQTGHILNIQIKLSSGILPEQFIENYPVTILLDKGLDNLTNQIVLRNI